MDCGDLGKDLCPLWEKSGRYKVFLWKPKCRVAVTDAGKRHLAQHALPRQPRGDLESELGQQGMREKEVLIWGHAWGTKRNNKLTLIQIMCQALSALRHLLIQSFPEARRETRNGDRLLPGAQEVEDGAGSAIRLLPWSVLQGHSICVCCMPNSPASLLPSYLAMSFPICALFLSLSLTHLESDPQLCFSNRLWLRLITWLSYLWP